jgi:tetratricopeptide (TPR) repeat protein
MVTKIVLGNYISSIVDIVTSLCKLFAVTEHQAAGPDVIDPIIIQEGKVTNKSLTKLIHLHKDSILRPSIIILLQDNDFERAKKLLSECPDGINVKMIRNNGEETIYKDINCGAEDVDSFITSYSEQCYSTCSNTKREVLLNSNWTDNSVISTFSPLLFRYRANLLFDQKEEVIADLSRIITNISDYEATSTNDDLLLRTLECVAKLYRVFCNDHGGQDIVEAEKLARSLENEVLLAQVYKCADLMPNCSRDTKFELYDKSYEIFKRSNMEDHAIYCKNNMLIEQFYSDYISPEQFNDMFVEAINNVPGMVGLTHIFNNVGVAYLYCGQATEAIEIFGRGLVHATSKNRIVQKLALESNRLIAESYSFCIIDENRIRFLMRQIFDGMGIKRLPFLAADYMLNTLSVAYRQNPQLGDELINMFPVKELLSESFKRSVLSASERILQIQYLALKHSSFNTLIQSCNVPKITNMAGGKRKEFILRYGFSPFDFSTWM